MSLLGGGKGQLLLLMIKTFNNKNKVYQIFEGLHLISVIEIKIFPNIMFKTKVKKFVLHTNFLF